MGKHGNVIISWVLALMMIISPLPTMSVFAQGSDMPIQSALEQFSPEPEASEPQTSESEAPKSDALEPEMSGSQASDTETSETQEPQVPEMPEQPESGASEAPLPEQPPELQAPPVAMPFAAPADKTDVVKAANPSFSLKVTQDSSVIPVDGTLNGRSNFTIELTDIWVPTRGDRTNSDGSDIILKGDTVTLSKADYFPDVNLTLTGSSPVKIGSDTIATVTFAADKITILFNGADIFFGGGKKDVKISLSVTAKAADQTPGVSKDTSIFGHNYKLENPALEPQYGITLVCNNPSGHYSWINATAFREGAIEWKAVVTAADKSDATIQMALNDLVFSSGLEGAYVADSFKVSKVQVVGGVDQPPIVVEGAAPTIDGAKMTYAFPSDFGAYKAVITFKTWIPKAKYYTEYHGTNGGLVDPNTSSNQSVSTTAKLLDQDGVTEKTAEVSASAALTPDWIQQYGKVSKSESDTLITWTIDVNKRNHHRANTPKTGLKSITIEDILPTGTEFVSASYTVNGVGKGAIVPESNVFTIGDAEGPVQLVIVSKVTGSGTSFTNVPKAKWTLDQTNDNGQDNDVGVTASTTVTIGAHSFSKSGAWVRDSASAKWTINLTLQYDLPGTTVYDLLVYGGSLNVLDSLDANTDVTPQILAAIKSKIDNRQLWQKYRAGTLTTGSGLTGKVITLESGGVPVADLVMVTGFKGETTGTVSFESATTNVENLFRQDGGGAWSNRALFFEGDGYLDSKDAGITAGVRMLNKEMLYAASPLDANGNVVKVHDWRQKSTAEMNFPAINHPRWYTSSNFSDDLIRYGYDQATRTVTFRLAINQAGFNTDKIAVEGGERVASDIKLVDTLPLDWEFVDYDATGKRYELLAGSSPGNGVDGGSWRLVNPGAVIPQGAANHGVSNFTANGNVGIFTFSKLTGTYIILVKARPTNAALAAYQLGDNKVTNTAEFSMKWGNTLKSATETHPVIVPMRSLGKTVRKPASGVQEWTVNYTPPFIMKQGVYLQDTLGAGLQLRKELDGSLSLAPSDLAVYKGKLKPDGGLERDGAPLNLADPNCEVKVSVEWGDSANPTKLKFEMDDPNQLYQFVYQTESKGMTAGSTAGNKIELLGDDSLPPIFAQSSIALDSNDVSGNATDNGLLYLKKVAPNGTTPLAGVKFELFNPDGTPAKNKNGTDIGEKITVADGKTNFIIQTPGLYQLKQTYIDEKTYLPTTTVYWVRVIDAPGCPVLVDGTLVTSGQPLIVPTPDSGKLTVKNTVEGNGGDLNKEFEFTVTFGGIGKDESYLCPVPGDPTARIKSGDTFKLKHEESFVIPKLPAGLTYTVTETDYTGDEYTTNPASRERAGTIAGGGDHKAEFVNTRNLTGGLLIGQTVRGNGADQEKPFEFIITFGGLGKDETYHYTKSDGSSGTIQSGGKISLEHGQTAAIPDILAGTTYVVTETDYTGEGYSTDPPTRTRGGTILEKQTSEAHFVNEKWLPGSLLVSNTVKGSGGDQSKDFTYTLTFSDGKTYSYTKTGNGTGSTGTIASGDTVTLKHGETMIVSGIPKDVDYTVLQGGYRGDGYTTDPAALKYEGTIATNTQAKAPFENTRQLPGTLELKTKPAADPGEPKDSAKVPGDALHPAQLIATLIDESGKPVVGEVITFKHKNGDVAGTAITDGYGKAVLAYTPAKVMDTEEDEYPFTATTTITSSSGVPYKESNEVKVIATPAALFGILRDNKTGQVIPFVEITVKNKTTGETVTIKTDENGVYRQPVNRDEEYTITYNRTVNIGGVDQQVPFTQKADTEGITAVEGKEIPAEITAVGIVLFKQPDGQKSLLTSAFAGKLNVYLKDGAGNYVQENGVPKAFPLDSTYGTFAAPGLSEQTYTMEVRCEVAPGRDLILTTAQLNVRADGELNISQELIDPYGFITDKVTGAAIEGAEVTLYYADTQRNRDAGIVPGSKVTLPEIEDFAPNKNASPSQKSDATGAYAYMVYPYTDYYLVVTKAGYVPYNSGKISVETDIVRHDVQMTKASTSSGGGRDSDSDSSTTHKLTIRGSSASGKKTYVLTLDKSGSFYYSGTKTGRIRSGDTIILGPDDYIIIEGLPSGTTYKLSEVKGNASVWEITGSMNKDRQEQLDFGKALVPNTGDDAANDYTAFELLGFALLLTALIGLDLRLRRRSKRVK